MSERKPDSLEHYDEAYDRMWALCELLAVDDADFLGLLIDLDQKIYPAPNGGKKAL